MHECHDHRCLHHNPFTTNKKDVNDIPAKLAPYDHQGDKKTVILEPKVFLCQMRQQNRQRCVSTQHLA